MRLISTLTITVVFIVLTGVAAPARAGGSAPTPLHWVLQHSPTTSDLADISCASTAECFAVGSHATILKTEDGGTAWRVVRPHYAVTHPAAAFVSVRCPVSGVCSVLASPNVILRTTDGGRTWRKRVIVLPPQLSKFDRLACPTRPVCYLTASPAGSPEPSSTDSAAMYKTSDGNRTWQPLSIPSSTPCDGDCTTTSYDLQWISCQSGQSCYAGGSTFIDSHTGYADVMIRTTNGTSWNSTIPCATPPCLSFVPTAATCPTVSICTGVYYSPGSVDPGPDFGRTTNGGKTWSIKSVTTVLTAIACTGKTFCELAGPHGKLAMATGSSLSLQASPTTRDLTAVACPGVRACYAVGAGGTIVARKK